MDCAWTSTVSGGPLSLLHCLFRLDTSVPTGNRTDSLNKICALFKAPQATATRLRSIDAQSHRSLAALLTQYTDGWHVCITAAAAAAASSCWYHIIRLCSTSTTSKTVNSDVDAIQLLALFILAVSVMLFVFLTIQLDYRQWAKSQ